MKKVAAKKNPSKKAAPQSKEANKTKLSAWFGIFIIVLLGSIIYSNSFGCSFHFDDIQNIVNNTSIRKLTDIGAWWNFYPSRPVSIFTFALNYHFHQLDVWGYHFINLAVHLINACLVYWLTLLIFSSPGLKEHRITPYKNQIAFITALLFVSHPLATQSVTYIVQRMASLAAMFYLMSVVFYIKARLSSNAKRLRILLFVFSFMAAVLAFLTKENAFTLPFAILLAEFLLLREKGIVINFRDYRLYLFFAAKLALLAFILFRFSFGVFKPIPPAHGHTYTLTALNYLFTQFSVIVKYIQLLLFPVNQMLDYDFPVTMSFFGLRTILSFLFLSGLMILAFLLIKKHRVISFGIFWFFLTLAVESSIIPIEDVIYEHRTYLPSVGFFLIIGSVFFMFFWEKYRYIAVAVFTVVILSNSYLTYERNKVWKNEFTLMNDNVEKAPGFARPLSNRGVEYSKIEQWDKALADYTKAIEINPVFERAWYNRGVAYAHFEQWEKAINDYSRAIEIFPDYAEAYYNRGVAEINLGQWEKALADYTRAIQIFPAYADAYHNRGLTYAHFGQWDKAMADYAKAIAIDPNYAAAYSSRGVAYANQMQWDKAIADFSAAIRINPKDKEGFFNRGNAYAIQSQWQKAVDDFNAALALDPNLVVAQNNRDIAVRNLQGGK